MHPQTPICPQIPCGVALFRPFGPVSGGARAETSRESSGAPVSPDHRPTTGHGCPAHPPRAGGLLLADFPCGLIGAPVAIPPCVSAPRALRPAGPVDRHLCWLVASPVGRPVPACAPPCGILWDPVPLLWVVLCWPVAGPVASCGRPVLLPVASCGRSCVHTGPSCGALWGGDTCDWPVEGPNSGYRDWVPRKGSRGI